MKDAKSIGKIQKVNLREIWKKEDRDFTSWLEHNIEYLSDRLDFDLNVISKDKDVGPFRVDLYAEDDSGKIVIIENQLEKTDHDHLGKVITYLTNLDAKIGIWITSNPRDEHIRAVEWLNENAPGDVSFYLIKLEAIRIEPQPMAAPLFTIVAEPTKEKKQLGEERKQYAQRHVLREEFWTRLLEKANKKTTIHSNVTPSRYSYISAGAGKSGVVYYYGITNKYGSCEIYLDRGKEFEEPNINKIRYDRLFKRKKEIEKDFGGKLDWERLDNRRASRISVSFEGIGLKDEEDWDALQDKMIDAMIRLEKATKKHIRKLE